MKRSKMLSIIANGLDHIIGDTNIRPNELALSVLEMVEGLGMLPPATDTNVWSKRDNWWAKVNEWESESET